MRLKVGLVVAAILAFGAQSVAAGTNDASTAESTTTTEQTAPAPPTTQPTTTPATSTTVGVDGADAQATQEAKRKNEGPAGSARRPGRRGRSEQVVPTPPPPIPPAEILPANSGNGRRIVYHKTRQRVWLVDGNNNVVKTHLVSGRLTWDQPKPGQHFVFSRSLYTCAVGNSSVCWKYMVRFTYGPGGLAIGFHEIPTNFATGQKLQRIDQLGTPLSAGCVRQAPWDAKFLWDWAPVGTQVIVIQ